MIQNRYESKEKIDKPTYTSANIDQLERSIIEILKKKPTTIEELSNLLNMNPMELLGKVSMMELEYKLIVHGENIYL